MATNKPEQKLREGTQGRFSLPGEPQARNCSLSITDVNAGDSGTYFFLVETHFRKFPYLNKMFFLNVTGMVGVSGRERGAGNQGWVGTPGQANNMPRGPHPTLCPHQRSPSSPTSSAWGRWSPAAPGT